MGTLTVTVSDQDEFGGRQGVERQIEFHNVASYEFQNIDRSNWFVVTKENGDISATRAHKIEAFSFTKE